MDDAQVARLIQELARRALTVATAESLTGGGLVMDSNPDSETLETVNKSAAPLRAVLTASGLAPLDADAAVNATK